MSATAAEGRPAVPAHHANDIFRDLRFKQFLDDLENEERAGTIAADDINRAHAKKPMDATFSNHCWPEGTTFQAKPERMTISNQMRALQTDNAKEGWKTEPCRS